MNHRIFNSKDPVIFDGAMGTTLLSLGIKINQCPEYLNVQKPEIIVKIHKAFVDSGSQVIQTNTFGANRIKLSKYGLEDKVEEINKAAVVNAKKAAGNRAKVAVSVGPTGKIVKPWGSLDFDEAIEVFKEQIGAALLEKPDLIIIETMTQLAEARAALLAAKSLTEIPIITTLSFEKHFRTSFGSSPEAAAITLDAMGTDVVGINCVGDFDILSDIVQRMVEAIGKPVIVQANAGNPKLVGDSVVYPITPEVFAEETIKLVKKGALFVGGCCGTTPDHIQALSQKLNTCSFPVVAKAPLMAATSNFDAIFFDPQKTYDLLGNANITLDNTLENNSDLIEDAKGQRDSGAEIINVKLGPLGEGDANKVKRAVLSLQKSLRSPICFEGNSKRALEVALKYYQGRAVIKGEKLQEKDLYAIANKYGALIL